jgi:hypothetical protein
MLGKKVKKSRMSDLNSPGRFAEDEGKDKPALDQIEAFINKVRSEMSSGGISETAGQNLIHKASSLLEMIKG